MLPEDTPFAFVSTKPHAGWTVSRTERTLDTPVESDGFTLTKAVATITWTAQKGQGIASGEFDEFEVSVGPFPRKVSALNLPATQTYSDGTTVRWNEAAVDGKAEPEHPAPVLKLATQMTAPAPAPDDDSDSLARWLAVAGVVLAGGALLVALLDRRRPVT